MILVDSSLWIEHLRHGHDGLAEMLDQGDVLAHPFVIGELACGHLKNRDEILELLADLPLAPQATDTEALALIDRRRLMGEGLGYIDVHLLASTALAGTATLWTLDNALARAAAKLGLAHK